MIDENDFDRELKSTQRIICVLGFVVAAFWVCLITLIIWAVYSFATADFKEVAREAGSIAKEFSDATNQEQPK